jgi:hypothetical protein
MPRRLRCNTGGYAYHALNRAVGRATLFHKDGDYAAFEKALRQAKDWRPVRANRGFLDEGKTDCFRRSDACAGGG